MVFENGVIMLVAFAAFIGFGIFGAVMTPATQLPDSDEGMLTIDRYFSPGQGIEYLITTLVPEYKGIELSMCMGC